jgi:hypothetical protein
MLDRGGEGPGTDRVLGREAIVADAVYVVMTLAFFALAQAYAHALDKLGSGGVS